MLPKAIPRQAAFVMPGQGSGAMDSPATIERQLHLAVQRRTQALDEVFQAMMLIISLDQRIDVLLLRRYEASDA